MIERNTKTLIERITDKKKKQDITRHILEALPEWFEVEQSREQYSRECADWLYFAAVDDGKGRYACKIRLLCMVLPFGKIRFYDGGHIFRL